eukprot:308549-Rhodomonas_salina.1
MTRIGKLPEAVPLKLCCRAGAAERGAEVVRRRPVVATVRARSVRPIRASGGVEGREVVAAIVHDARGPDLVFTLEFPSAVDAKIDGASIEQADADWDPPESGNTHLLRSCVCCAMSGADVTWVPPRPGTLEMSIKGPIRELECKYVSAQSLRCVLRIGLRSACLGWQES